MSVPSGSARPDRATLAAFAGVVLFGGVNSIAVHATVQELAPFWGAAVRFLGAGLLLVALVVATRRTWPRGRSLLGAGLYGAIGFAGSFGFAYPALRQMPASTAQVLISLTPLFTFAFAIAHRQERFRLQGLGGALIALAGVAVVFLDQLGADVPATSLVFVIATAACIAESGVILKWIPRSDPFATNAVAMLTGGLILLALSAAAGETWAAPTRTATQLAIGYLVVFGSVVMFGLYLFALQRWTASAVSYSTLLLPLVTIAVATVLTGERPTPSFVLGGGIVLVGVYVGSFLRIRRGRSSASSLPECLPIDACGPPVPVQVARRLPT